MPIDILLCINFLLPILIFGIPSSINAATSVAQILPLKIPEASGRDVSSISTDKITGKWLFTECSSQIPAGCHILTYDLRLNHLRRYELSNSYLYAHPRFSDDGRKIVANRSPVHDGTPEGRAASTLKTEAIIFDEKGGKLDVLLDAGPNLGPVISPSGNFVAYWKTTPKPQSSSRMNSGSFDLYVFDFKTKSEILFSGTNRFYSAGSIYFKSDTLIYSSASTPEKRVTADIGEYRRQTNGSEIFEFNRETATAKEIFTDFRHSHSFSVDRQGNACFIGERVKEGSSFIEVRMDGSKRFVAVPPVSFINEAVCEPSGESMIFIYPADNTSYAERRFGFGSANFTTGAITAVKIPPLQDAEVIKVN